jgi:hypothetical protein
MRGGGGQFHFGEDPIRLFDFGAGRLVLGADQLIFALPRVSERPQRGEHEDQREIDKAMFEMTYHELFALLLLCRALFIE